MRSRRWCTASHASFCHAGNTYGQKYQVMRGHPPGSTSVEGRAAAAGRGAATQSPTRAGLRSMPPCPFRVACFCSYKVTTHERHTTANHRDAVDHPAVGSTKGGAAAAPGCRCSRALLICVSAASAIAATRTTTSAPPASPIVAEMRARAGRLGSLQLLVYLGLLIMSLCHINRGRIRCYGCHLENELLAHASEGCPARNSTPDQRPREMPKVCFDLLD